MPESEDARLKRLERDREKKRRRRASDPNYVERERLRQAERDRTEEYRKRRESEEFQEREKERESKRVRNRRKVKPEGPDYWSENDWTNGYIIKRDGNENYRPFLELLHLSDMRMGTIRVCVYETTPLEIDVRREIPRVWQTYRSATIQIPGEPLIKRFKVLDPKEDNPIPIGEGELVRRYLGQFGKGKRNVFPKCRYDAIVNAPIYFMPLGPPDLMEFDCEYVDISRCYSQLLERLPSLVIKFDYGRKLFQPVDLPAYDADLLMSKHWGRAIVGMLRQKKGRCFIYGEPKTFPSRYYHGDTANWIHGVLHSLASYAIDKCGCYRWHTDGGFFPENGGKKFCRLLDSLGLTHTLEEFALVCFASVDQYEAISHNGNVKQTRLFLSTYIDDYVFSAASSGGSQRDNIIKGMDSNFFYKTLEREYARI